MNKLLAPLFVVCASCAAQPVAPAKSSEAPPAVAAEPAVASTAPAATPAPGPEPTPAAPAADAAPAKLTKAQLEDANKLVMDEYPAPFQQTFDKVVAKIGEPATGAAADNMFKWFAPDGDKCTAFFMTKDAKKGYAASGLTDEKPGQCGLAAK